jgi:hypothetical protein
VRELAFELVERGFDFVCELASELGERGFELGIGYWALRHLRLKARDQSFNVVSH